MNTEKEYLSKLTNDLAREIDFEVLSQMLEEQGWTSVVFDPFDFNRSAVMIEQWAAVHCTGQWRNWAVKFVFERAEDATCAVLKWK